jgi:hypothetical protein
MIEYSGDLGPKDLLVGEKYVVMDYANEIHDEEVEIISNDIFSNTVEFKRMDDSAWTFSGYGFFEPIKNKN